MRRSQSQSILAIAILSLISLPIIGSAQRRDYVNQTIINQLNGIFVFPWTSDTVNNIGQVYHQVTAVGTDAPAHTCTDPKVSGFLEGSYNGTAYLPIFTIANQTAGVNTGARVYTQSGLSAPLPYFKVVITSFDTTNCLLAIYYTGGIYPVVPFVQPSQSVINNFLDLNTTITDVGAGNAILYSPATTSASVVPYGLTLTNTDNVDDTITIGYGVAGNSCASFTVNAPIRIYVVKASSTLLVSQDNTPLMYLGPVNSSYGQPLCVQYGALAGRHLFVGMVFRPE